MHFHTIKAGRNGVRRRLTKIIHDARQLAQLQRTRLGNIMETVVHERLGLRPNRRRRNRRSAIRLQIHMRNTPHVPQLHKNTPAPGMHLVRHLAPAINLRLGIDTRRVLITLRLRRNLSGLGDQQTGRSTLTVIGCSKLARHPTCPRTVAGQRGHDNTIGEDEIA